MNKAFVSFLNRRGNNKAWYRMRFNMHSAKLLKDVEFVTIGKADGYIVLAPQKLPTPGCLRVGTDSYGYPYITMNKVINSQGFLNASLFDGTRYVVKKGKNGNKIYICLKEVADA